MSLSPPIVPATPPLSPAEMDLLVARTGLTLNPGQMADLVLAWRQVAALIAAIPRSTALLDDQAYVFRLPGPPAAPTPHKPASMPGLKAKPAAKAKKPEPKKPQKAKSSPARKSAKPVRKR
jgi:hypothetical protein